MPKVLRSRLKMGLLLILAGFFLIVWVSVILADAPPVGLWLTEDGSLAVATGPCNKEAATLCAIVVAVPGAARDRVLARYKDVLCDLPIFWDLSWSVDRSRWEGGKILDPETEKIHDLVLTVKSKVMSLLVFSGTETEGIDLTWLHVRTAAEQCP